MGIEHVSPDLVRINGQFVEIRDTREPDVFDKLSEKANREIQARYAAPVGDVQFDVRYTPSFGLSQESVAYQLIPRFIALARQAAIERAVSYRNFRVGALGYAVSSTTPMAAYLYGANLTPYEGAPKRCAEMEVIAKARQKGFDHLIALAIFGPTEFDDVNTVPSKALLPCDQCRELFAGEPLVKDDTLVVSANEEDQIELMFVNDLLALHNPDQPQ